MTKRDIKGRGQDRNDVTKERARSLGHIGAVEVIYVIIYTT